MSDRIGCRPGFRVPKNGNLESVLLIKGGELAWREKGDQKYLAVAARTRPLSGSPPPHGRVRGFSSDGKETRRDASRPDPGQMYSHSADPYHWGPTQRAMSLLIGVPVRSAISSDGPGRRVCREQSLPVFGGAPKVPAGCVGTSQWPGCQSGTP